MFAVPGWSVSADSLKPDTGSESAPSHATAGGKKRKRHGGDDGDKVTASNVADLWESVVEGKEKAQTKPAIKRKSKEQQDQHKQQQQQGDEEVDHSAKKQKKEKKKKNKDKTKSAGDDEEKADAPPPPPAPGPDEKPAQNSNEDASPASRKQKKTKKDKAQAQASNVSSPSSSRAAASSATTSPSLPPAPPKLTPLQKSMREKLVSARFRHLNETLYTRPSEEAFRLFAESPEMFDEYHEGFRRQVKVWPENPVDSFLRDLRSRAAVKQPFSKGKSGGGTTPIVPLLKTHLPRTQGTCVVADLGCGDARLAESLQKDASKLRLDVKSFDLQSPSSLVTKADIANLPLPDGSVNVAIFCLALMGTNWLDFVEEAYRILHWKGELWVAEIKSRFTHPSKAKVVTHSVGHRRKNATPAANVDPEDNGAEDLAVEVDGADDRRRETDVSAFVEALRKRGFVLHGEKGEAVDLSNKMFVKMRFLKAAAPTKGKGMQADESAAPRGKKATLKWPNGKVELNNQDDVDENKILKACLYKIR